MAADPVTASLDVADDVLKLTAQKDAQANTAAEVAAKQARELQSLKDQINQALENGDLTQIRRLCA
ncbi:hypothetical protein [Silvimonas sp.]|uniref:hypothetical protein n=1 Tax=Silvimonas sp. TaxID=2650811 RepID=UPI002850D8C8|nr:hypothetical protein [Silvimonas sp.]MDR3427839.1 hypothetical protein [Silvimonas sp.]